MPERFLPNNSRETYATTTDYADPMAGVIFSGNLNQYLRNENRNFLQKLRFLFNNYTSINPFTA